MILPLCLSGSPEECRLPDSPLQSPQEPDSDDAEVAAGTIGNSEDNAAMEQEKEDIPQERTVYYDQDAESGCNEDVRTLDGSLEKQRALGQEKQNIDDEILPLDEEDDEDGEKSPPMSKRARKRLLVVKFKFPKTKRQKLEEETFAKAVAEKMQEMERKEEEKKRKKEKENAKTKARKQLQIALQRAQKKAIEMKNKTKSSDMAPKQGVEEKLNSCQCTSDERKKLVEPECEPGTSQLTEGHIKSNKVIDAFMLMRSPCNQSKTLKELISKKKKNAKKQEIKEGPQKVEIKGEEVHETPDLLEVGLIPVLEKFGKVLSNDNENVDVTDDGIKTDDVTPDNRKDKSLPLLRQLLLETSNDGSDCPCIMCSSIESQQPEKSSILTQNEKEPSRPVPDSSSCSDAVCDGGIPEEGGKKSGSKEENMATSSSAQTVSDTPEVKSTCSCIMCEDVIKPVENDIPKEDRNIFVTLGQQMKKEGAKAEKQTSGQKKVGKMPAKADATKEPPAKKTKMAKEGSSKQKDASKKPGKSGTKKKPAKDANSGNIFDLIMKMHSPARIAKQVLEAVSVEGKDGTSSGHEANPDAVTSVTGSVSTATNPANVTAVDSENSKSNSSLASGANRNSGDTGANTCSDDSGAGNSKKTKVQKKKDKPSEKKENVKDSKAKMKNYSSAKAQDSAGSSVSASSTTKPQIMEADSTIRCEVVLTDMTNCPNIPNLGVKYPKKHKIGTGTAKKLVKKVIVPAAKKVLKKIAVCGKSKSGKKAKPQFSPIPSQSCLLQFLSVQRMPEPISPLTETPGPDSSKKDLNKSATDTADETSYDSEDDFQ